MRFTETRLRGSWLIDIDPFPDERGFFATAWKLDELRARGLSTTIVQSNIAWNRTRGTLRGMHFQTAPFEEAKLVRCTRGAVLDVIIDLRQDSPTFCQWFSVELNEHNRRILYIPPGFAHGYQTLTDDAETYYHVSAPYAPNHATGVRWNDPLFAIDWPVPPTVMSKRDQEWPDFKALP